MSVQTSTPSAWRRLVRAPLARACALLGAVCLLLTPQAQAQSAAGGAFDAGTAPVVGSGRMASQTRAIPTFEAVTVNGPINAVLRPGLPDTLTLRADDNLLSLIETRVVTRGAVPTLEIGPRPGSSFTTRNEISVAVGFATLRSVALSGTGGVEVHTARLPSLSVVVQGSGSARLLDASIDALSVSIAGSGSLQVDGRAERLSVELAGSGDLDAARLDAGAVAVSIVGSGNASVNARSALSVSIAGSGDVIQRGAAVPRTSIAGSGSVRRH